MLVAKGIGADQQAWNQVIQRRVKNTSSILGSMKAIKISGMSRGLARSLQDQREEELFVSRAFFKGIMWLNGLGLLSYHPHCEHQNELADIDKN